MTPTMRLRVRMKTTPFSLLMITGRSFSCSFSPFNAVFPVVNSNTQAERDNNRTKVMMMIRPHDETGVRVGK